MNQSEILVNKISTITSGRKYMSVLHVGFRTNKNDENSMKDLEICVRKVPFLSNILSFVDSQYRSAFPALQYALTLVIINSAFILSVTFALDKLYSSEKSGSMIFALRSRRSISFIICSFSSPNSS